ncbi:prepilin peptidase, partial [Turicibacter sanguinis]|nr:prepilin peptidase [Turicibacter sanguinis]
MKRLGDLIPKTFGAEQAYQELLNEPEIAQALKCHESEVDMSRLSSFISDLDEYSRNKSKCEGCLGLDYCKQPVKGHRPELEPRYKQLKIAYTPCHYELNQKHLANIKSFHMPGDIVNANFERFIMDPERVEFYEKATLFINEYMTNKKGRG